MLLRRHQHRLKKYYQRYLAVLLLVTSSMNASEEPLPTKAVDEFVTVLEQIKRNYVFAQTDPVLIEAAIRGMVSSLDPHSRYMNAEELSQFESVSNANQSSAPAIWSIDVLDSGVIYLDINFFHLSLAKYIRKALADVSLEQGLIIDLRDNGGGFVDSAVELADLFLDAKLVVHARGRSAAANRYLSATSETPFPQVAILVLVNEGTASAAEIFSAAIQDHERGIIIGTNTYGKGSVQSLIYTQFGAVQITTSMNYRPSGTAIQGMGISPNVDLLQPELHQDLANYPVPTQQLISLAIEQFESQPTALRVEQK